MLTTVDGIVHVAKLMNAWPNRHLSQYTAISVETFDDIMQTIDYTLSNWSDCSEIICRFGSVGYVRGRNADAEVLLSNRFLIHIKFQVEHKDAQEDQR